MAITLSTTQVAESALRLALTMGGEGSSNLRLEDCFSMINQAVLALCDEVVASPNRYLLQLAVTTVPLTAGIGTLPTNVYAQYIGDGFGTLVIHSSYTKPLIEVPFIHKLYYPQRTGVSAGLYFVSGNSSQAGAIHAFSSLGAPLTGSLTVHGLSARQLFAGLAPEMQEPLIMKLATMAKAKLTAKPVPPPPSTMEAGNG